MKVKKNWYYILVFMLLIGILQACGKDEKSKKEAESPKEDVQAPALKEVEHIPADEKDALIAVIEQHAAAFNQRDLEAYMELISKEPSSFDFDEEKAYIKTVFETMDIKLEPVETVVTAFEETEATIVTMMNTIIKDHASGKELTTPSKQVNTLAKEDGQWKIKAVFAIGEENSTSS